MRARAMPRPGHALAWLASALAAFVIGGFLFAWSGLFNIGASRGHWSAVEWLLQFGMKNSVERRAWFIEVPPLDDPDLYLLGAAHFHRACVSCHGAPGMPADPVMRQALPPPPDLTHVSQKWRDSELFWIIKHGIKYTGMPAWLALERDDEIWAVVAYLKRSPQDMSHQRAVAGVRETPPRNGREIAMRGLGDTTSACVHCHGAEGLGPRSGLVPVLHGQSAAFLAASLRAYASGERRSGIMQPIASQLAPDAIDGLARYYASLPAPPLQATVPQAAQALATSGDAEARIPACTGCHGSAALPLYPKLAGQNARYMANRLQLWRNGLAPTTDGERLMAPIARLLTADQIQELSAFFSAQPADRGAGPSR
jgi:cytochrome c553